MVTLRQFIPGRSKLRPCVGGNQSRRAIVDFTAQAINEAVQIVGEVVVKILSRQDTTHAQAKAMRRSNKGELVLNSGQWQECLGHRKAKTFLCFRAFLDSFFGQRSSLAVTACHFVRQS